MAGEQIGTFVPGSSTGIEIGFADSNGVPLSHANYHEGDATRWGRKMASFLSTHRRPGQAQRPVQPAAQAAPVEPGDQAPRPDPEPDASRPRRRGSRCPSPDKHAGQAPRRLAAATSRTRPQ